MNTLFSLMEIMLTKKLYYFIYILFLPISILLEIILYFYYWRKIILPEMLTNDEITNFLVRNEFGYKFYKIYKKDVIEQDSYLDNVNYNDLPYLIKNEISNALLELFKKHVNINIENYINVFVNVKYKILNSGIKLKIYSCDIRFYRYKILINDFKYLIIWIILFLVIYYLIVYILNNFEILLP